jgi:uncharacterized protein YbaP (TraB family)
MRSKVKAGSVSAAVILAACSATPAPASDPVAGSGPALWQVADSDTSIYLFGTIHLLPEGSHWRTPTLDRSIAEADGLVIEVTLGDDPIQLTQLIAKLGTSPNLPPLAERIPPDKREALTKMVAASGFPAAFLDKLESWAAAFILIQVSFQQMGFKGDLGVESQLTQTYRQAKKPILALETVEQQLGFFDQLSEEAQRSLLVASIEDPEAGRAEFQRMLKAWLAGDVNGIAATFDSETVLSPELRDVLMRKRNAAWADWIQKRLEQPGTIFIAVGAGHLAGPDSVQHMLERKGVKPRRLE